MVQRLWECGYLDHSVILASPFIAFRRILDQTSTHVTVHLDTMDCDVRQKLMSVHRHHASMEPHVL